MQKYLDKLNLLPPKQKAMVAAGAILGVLAVFYLLLISPAADDADRIRAQANSAQRTLRKLKVKADPKAAVKLDPANDPARLRTKLDELVARLAKGGTYSNLVHHLKREADALGLKMTKITRVEPYKDDYVLVSPIRIEAKAAFPVLVSFFDKLSKEKERTLVVSNLFLRSRPVKEFMPKHEPGSILRQNRDQEGSEESIARAKIRKLDAYITAANIAMIRINFNVDAYTYTGKSLTAEERKELGRKR